MSPCSLINFHLPSHPKEIIIFQCYCKLYFTFQQYRGITASRGLVQNLLKLSRNISIDCKCIQDKPATGQTTLPASSGSAPPLQLNKFVFFFCCPPSCRPSALPHHPLGTQQKRQGSPWPLLPVSRTKLHPNLHGHSAHGARPPRRAWGGWPHPHGRRHRQHRGAERQAHYPPPATSRLCRQRPPSAGPARQRLTPPRPAPPHSVRPSVPRSLRQCLRAPGGAPRRSR